MARKKLQYDELMDMAASFVAERKHRVNTPQEVADLMRPLVQDKEQECLWVLSLSAKNIVRDISEVTKGLADRAYMHAREVFRTVILAHAVRVIVVHNHPSGDAAPSPQDIACTLELTKAGEILRIPVIDHIIMGSRCSLEEQDFCSMREAGHIQ